jgi:hypothetical protein
LYDRLEEQLESGGQESPATIDNIIAQLRIRSGAYGIERKNLVNNLFKSIIDLSFPQTVKYLFWACDQDTGIFEHLDSQSYLKYKRMSKYKKEEMQFAEEQYDRRDEEVPMVNEEDANAGLNCESINQLLDINVE